MATRKRKILKWTGIVLLILAVIAWFVYRYLFPAGPILDPVPNEIRDRSSQNWTELEERVPLNEQRNLYWGDMHVHTALSFDAYIGGILPLPDDAYRFAKGEAIKVFTEDVRITRPLDFAAVTDHSEYLGELYSIHTPGAPAHNAFVPRYFRSVGMDTIKQLELFQRLLRNAGRSSGRSHLPFFQGFETTKSAWDIHIKAAENHYQPGSFTTFAAYEWTLGVDLAHAHRNVFFKDMNVPDYPVSAIEADNEEQLWASLAKFREGGATVMAVPHNSNLSEGSTFPLQSPEGTDFDEKYLTTRRLNEPLVEIHQAKGNSEVHPALWSSDEFADFEVYNQGELNINNYVRHVLKRGVQYQSETGINPFQYGIIGSTDTHNGTPGNTEENDEFKGNHAFVDYTPLLRKNRAWVLNRNMRTRDAVNPGGLMAVWSKANSRPEIYEAMERKETYATSGVRIQVRFFAGYGLGEFDTYEHMVAKGYNGGVHMGQTLSGTEDSPEFFIWAAKDPEGANLDRIQVVKGWVDDEGLQEKIYDVFASDGRTMDANGEVEALDSGLNWKTGEWDENVGAIELSGVWKDPEYEKGEEAFYYLRVLEVETPRWSLYDQVQTDISYTDDTKMTIHERAWSSPIWVTFK